MAKNVETKVEDLKEENKEETTELIVTEESKVRKIVKIALTGLAAVATGVVGFLIGRGTRGEDTDETQEETTEE